MADLTYIQATGETKIVGQDSSGNQANYVSADANGNMAVKDYSNGPVAPGSAANVSSLAGGQFNTTLPTLTNTQQSAIQLDSSGRILTSIIQKEFVSTNNSSTANLASSATFTGTSDSIVGYSLISVNFKADQPVTIQVEQSTDNSNWDIIDTYTLAANVGDGRTFNALSSYVRILVTNNGGSTTTFLRLQTILSPSGDASPRDLSQYGELEVVDTCNNGGVNSALTVGTSAVELKVGANRLAGRKLIHMQPQSNNIYYGFSNGVTTANGIQMFKNQLLVFPIGEGTQLWLIASNAGQTVNIAEVA